MCGANRTNIINKFSFQSYRKGSRGDAQFSLARPWCSLRRCVNRLYYSHDEQEVYIRHVLYSMLFRRGRVL